MRCDLVEGGGPAEKLDDEGGDAVLEKCDSADMRADPFTKGFTPAKWAHALELLGMSKSAKL